MVEKPYPDEIELYSLLVRVIKFIRNNLKTFMIFMLIGLMVGVARLSFQHPGYEARLIVQSDFVPATYCESIVNQLGDLIHNREYDSLGRALRLEKKEVDELSKIKVEAIDGVKILPRDSVFVIIADVKDAKILPLLERGIVGFLKSNKFINTTALRRTTDERSLSKKIKTEISSLDSLKGRLLTRKIQDGHVSEVMVVDPSSVHARIIALYGRQLSHDRIAGKSEGVEIISSFSPYKKDGFLLGPIQLLTWLSIGFIVALVFIGIRGAIHISRT